MDIVQISSGIVWFTISIGLYLLDRMLSDSQIRTLRRYLGHKFLFYGAFKIYKHPFFNGKNCLQFISTRKLSWLEFRNFQLKPSE